MELVGKIINILQTTMETPKPFGKFHIICILISLMAIIYLLLFKRKYREQQLKKVLAIYGIIALILEIGKQIIWSINYDPILKTISWDYQWYAAPFQFCTTPIYVCLICLYLKDCPLRKALLSYLAFFTILGSIVTVVFPDSCFVSTILVNIHTMWLHYGSLVVSVYLLINEIKPTKSNFIKGFIVFIVFVCIAEVLNISIYKSGILNGEEFNMFYISPYFTSSLPIFDTIQETQPFGIFIFLYILAIYLGGLIICSISTIVSKK